MDNLNSTEITQAEDPSFPKEPKKRNTYVSRDHKSMVEFVSGIYKSLGHSDYHTNKEIATIHGLSADSIKQQLSSCQQYKLLEIKFGTGYKITDLFKRIFLPLNENEKRIAIIESLKSPETYYQLFKDYEFHILPPLNGIKNHFVRNHHLKEDIAEKTAQIFIENLEDNNLLDSRGVLISGMKNIGNVAVETNSTNNLTSSLKETSESPEVKTELVVDLSVKMIDIIIPLKTTKNKAHLLIPEDYREEDLDRIAKFVEALK